MSRNLIWDAPVRTLHWIVAALFVITFTLATLASDESAAFVLHAALGLVLALAVVLRLAWAVIGTRHARFASYDLRPSSLVAYARSMFGRKPLSHGAHNPATSWFAVAVTATFVGVGATGILAGRGYEAAKEVHEVLAWTMAALVGAHVAGVLLHRVRFGENLAAAMLTGRKESHVSAAIVTTRPWVAGLFTIFTAVWATAVLRASELSSGRLTVPVVGTVLQVGENERHLAQATDEKRHDDDHERNHEHD